jgi:flagellar biosynthesis GTPase FlhF
MNPMMAMGGAQPGQPGLPLPSPPPQPPTPEQMALLDKPSWEQVMQLLKDNVHRSYRIDIETDSTIAGSIESDMAGLSQVMQGISVFMRETMPLVQAGMLPVEAQKEMLMTITRRARMGIVVEDALDKMQAPQQKQDPSVQIAQAKAQADAQQAQMDAALERQKMQMQAQIDERAKRVDLQIEQQRLAMEAQAEQQRQQNEMAVEAHKQEMQAQQVAHQNQLEAQREALRSQQEAQLEQMRIAMEERISARDKQIELILAQMNNATKIEVAEIGKEGGILAAEQTAAARDAADDRGVD